MNRKIRLPINGIVVFIILAGTVFFASCEKYSFVVETVNPVDSVHFKLVIQPMLNRKCASCHSGSKDPDLRSAYSYESLTTGGYVNLPAENSKLYTKVISSGHTAFTLPEEKLKILYWIAQGARNNK
ncbi:MAG TPA: hypothetical protein DDW27_19815 [Bacteroidales bacterium]|nr:hypothetical protein [Bacteroidales bacterium]